MEIEQSGRLTLAYQYDAGGAYVALVGRAVINDDVAAKTANWKPDSVRWFPGGPADPNVVYVDFTTERIELWSSPHGVEPDPVRGLWAGVLAREASGWVQSTTFPADQYGYLRGADGTRGALGKLERKAMTDIHEGGCLCGEVRYRVRGLPNEAIACHCTFCQRRTGGVVGVEVFFPEENIEFTGASHSTYVHRSDETGRWLRLDFCRRCGTTVGMTGEKRPGQRALMGGTFDDPNWFTIARHIWTRSKVHWLTIPANIPQS